MTAKAGAGIAVTCAFFGIWYAQASGLVAGDYENELKKGTPAEPRFDWKSVDRKHWQAQARGAAPTEERPELTDAREGNTAGCATGMVRVKGAFRLESGGEATGEIERLQDAACTDWISKEFPARCRTFDKERIDLEVAKLKTRPMDFCMDRFEYPNVLGQNPIIVVTFREAEALCKKSKKRLCTENEWTFACEGEEVRPYPYGYTRDSSACVVDRNWRPFTEGALSPRDGSRARDELDRLWQAEPSGSRGACRSPFGVYDMTGNVDEWTRTVRSTGFGSILKGGYWGPVRARCRPATRAHNEDFVAYQQGFRCCADSNASVPAPPPTPPLASFPGADAGTPIKPARIGAGLDPERATSSNTGDEGDELDALAKARARATRLTCATSPLAPSSGGREPGMPAAAALALALTVTVAAARRRR
ncbi:MAG: SUMF1/EgtB/PvdO family nonheme iron enzyme [Deltaproteobacteria bacterium]|nr:SUMF1/EgtB/PvdO family nonheme iron enzyme [Deltaproteobacteria bacterium]